LNSNFLVIAFRYAHYFRAQVDRAEVAFDNENYGSVVFSYYENDINPPIKEAGIPVAQRGSRGKEVELKCRAILSVTSVFWNQSYRAITITR
jgi:hypothetical protein